MIAALSKVRECVCETVRVHLVSLECLSNVNDSPGDQTDVTLTLSLRFSSLVSAITRVSVVGTD